MLHKLKIVAASVVLAAAGFVSTGCSPQPNHPNQLNQFDGLAYDSLLLAHGSISSLRVSVANQYPALAPQFNKVATSYTLAVSVYSAYRTGAASDLATSSALHDLTLSIIALESEFEIMFRGNGKAMMANKFAARAPGVYSPSELLTVLQLAAAIAGAVPGLQGQAGAAQVILAASAQALSEWKAMASAPIDLAMLRPIEMLS